MIDCPPIPEMQKAWMTRDRAYDGVFYIGVRTTGIFCMPSCPARRPKPENVTYHATVRDALFAGYRACKRCRPLDAPGSQPMWARDLLARIDASPGERIRDRDLRAMNIDPARARRYFKAHYDMTFHAYQRARRMGHALTEMRRGRSIDHAGLNSGYQSTSGFRDAFEKTMKTTPGQTDTVTPIVTRLLESPLGPMIAGATADALCLLEFSDRRMIEAQLETLQRRFKQPIIPGESPLLDQTASELDAYFAGERSQFDVPLAYPGTPFQVRVWDALCTIPYGETRSYEQLAEMVGSPGAQRAVGRANGMNRIGIIVPCHRVVNKSGKLGGYGGGLRRKEHLLNLERGEAALFADHSASAASSVSAGTEA